MRGACWWPAGPGHGSGAEGAESLFRGGGLPFVALAVASAVAWRCHSRPDAGVVRAVDSLNVCAGLLRHDHPDSAYALAAKAYTLSQDYPDGRSEALCHQMYICFLRMDYATERRLYDELQSFVAIR